MAQTRRWHWLAPTVMATSLFCGIMLALGHHLFYASLQHNPVSTTPYNVAGHNFAPQSFNTAVGTAFAFFVRLLLVTAMSTAYIQVFWHTVRNASPKPTLNELDWADNIVSNAVHILNLKMATRHYVLLLLAIIVWCVPIGTIFPPATLSVISVSRNISSITRVPTYDFASYKLSGRLVLTNGQMTGDHAEAWKWTGPSPRIVQLADSVMSTGRMLNFEAPDSALDSSWKTDISIPQIQCSNVTDGQKDAIFLNIWNAMDRRNSSGAVPQIYPYLSWVPWDGFSTLTAGVKSKILDPTLPFLMDNGTVYGPSMHTLSMDTASELFVAIAPRLRTMGMGWNILITGPDWSHQQFDTPTTSCQYTPVQSLTDTIENCTEPFKPAELFYDATLLRCRLRNASYQAHFSVTNGQQHIALTDRSDLVPTPVNTTSYFDGGSTNEGIYNYLSRGDYSTNYTRTTDWTCKDKVSRPCVFNESSMRLISYQSIAAAFNQFVVGAANTFFSVNGTLLKTVLAKSPELAFLESRTPMTDVVTGVEPAWKWQSNGRWLQKDIINSRNKTLMNFFNATSQPMASNLSSSLEQLFQNFTLSILSDPDFLANPEAKSLYTPSTSANVTITQPAIAIYAYDVSTLWIAYGISIGVTIIVVIIGAIALILNGVSYSDNFSTIFRVAKMASLSTEVKESDGSGCDPLPLHLRSAQLDMGTNVVNNRGYSAAPVEYANEEESTEDVNKAVVVHARTV